VLETLVRAGEAMPLSELAAAQRCVRSNMTQLVDRLEADGSVQRIADPDDRRSVRAILTPLGTQRQAEGEKKIEQFRAEFTTSLEPAELAVLQRLLDALS
jgi:DNA-binding MarR family transcriptional regulator